MSEYVVLYQHHNLVRIEAETAEHHPDDGVFTFEDGDKQTVAWVREEDVRALGLRSALGSP